MNFFAVNEIKRKEIFILILCFIIGFALRFYTFDKKSLWIDEIHTFNDSRDDLRGQLNFYEKNPTYLHPPLFFVLTHLFYPFTKPERDLRIIPLIFGTLSIPMIYFLAKSFSPHIALPCTLSLIFMAYHIGISQDGRPYPLLLFVGMAGLYFFIKHLQTSKKTYLLLVALLFSTLFYTSYSSIPFITLSQILWFYRPNGKAKKPNLSSFLTLNGFILLFCLPWILFVAVNYKGQTIMASSPHTESSISFWYIMYGVLHDWAPHVPLTIASVILLILFPIFSKFRKNAFLLLGVIFLPVGALCLFCKLFDFGHFVTSRYFIIFLPLFFITLFLSLNTIEVKFEGFRRLLRLRFLFTILFITSNLVILTPYYRSEKQDFRGLAAYLKGQLQDGDKIIVGLVEYIPGLLHYLGVDPKGRLHPMSSRKVSENEIEYTISLIMENKKFTISYSKTFWIQYILDRNRLWYVAGKNPAKEIKKVSTFIFKGYFDGSFCNFDRFPADASMYLFLWDPKSPDEKGIEMPIE